MLLATACRSGEIISATWTNCDMDKRVLNINSENSKSKKSRIIQLNDSAMEVLELTKTQGKYDHLFVNPRTKSRYYNLHKAWDKIRMEANLPKLRLHDLRHFVASELASSGVSIYIISKLLGHRNVVTSERYSHVSQPAVRNASDNISTVIQNALDKVS
jgi:integrase